MINEPDRVVCAAALIAPQIARPIAAIRTSRTGNPGSGVDFAFANHGCQPPQMRCQSDITLQSRLSIRSGWPGSSSSHLRGATIAHADSAGSLIASAHLRRGRPVCSPARQDRPDEEAFAAGVAEAELRRYVRELVAFGPRMGGTPSNDKSAAYLSAFFKKHGLTSRRRRIRRRWRIGRRAWQVALEDGAVIESAWPFGFSASTGGVREGKLLLVDELAKATPTGGVEGTRHLHARRRRPRLRRDRQERPPAGRDPDRALRTIRSATSTGRGCRRCRRAPTNPVPVFAVSYVDGRALASAAQAGRTVRVSLDATIREGRGKTVIATLRGQDADGLLPRLRARRFGLRRARRRRQRLRRRHGDGDRARLRGARRSGKVAAAEVLDPVRGVGRRVPLGAHLHRAAKGTSSRSSKGVLNFDETGTGAERDAIYFESNDVPWNETDAADARSRRRRLRRAPRFLDRVHDQPVAGRHRFVCLPAASSTKGTGQTTLQIPSTTIYTAAWDKLAELDQIPGWESKGTPDPKKLKIDYSLYYHSSGDTPENTTEREPQNMVRAVKVTGLALMRLNR